MVIKCDNRGSSRRGTAFEGPLKLAMGSVEVDDQVAAVRHFASLGLVAPGRVGIIGWSYGGYMAALCLCRAANVFSCAISGVMR